MERDVEREGIQDLTCPSCENQRIKGLLKIKKTSLLAHFENNKQLQVERYLGRGKLSEGNLYSFLSSFLKYQERTGSLERRGGMAKKGEAKSFFLSILKKFCYCQRTGKWKHRL